MISLSELPERIRSKIVPEPNTACWLWTGCLDRKGYGSVNGGRKGKSVLAHRFVFALANGPFEGLLDHACDQKCCVNPGHLRIMSSGENTRRYYAKQTHCANGHPLSGDNLYFENRLRKCKACHALYVRRWRARRKRYGRW
jgi:hypothetical protein